MNEKSERSAYQNCDTNEHNVCEEVSWLRESWGRCLELTSIRVHCIGVSGCGGPLKLIPAHKSMYRGGFRDQAQSPGTA
jgi:hypothetical protein